MPAGLDHWWDVDQGTKVDALALEAAQVILDHGLPFFDPFQSTQSLLTHLREGNGLPGLTDAVLPLVHAMLAVEVGSRAEAQELLTGAFLAAAASPFQETVRRIGERLGLSLG